MDTALSPVFAASSKTQCPSFSVGFDESEQRSLQREAWDD